MQIILMFWISFYLQPEVNLLSIKSKIFSYSIRKTISPYFDTSFYLRQLDEIDQQIRNPIEHYILVGASNGYDPSSDFSTSFYLANNIDVANSGVNPFWHYIKYGRFENRYGNPHECLNGHLGTENGETPEWEFIAQDFDTEFYRKNYRELPEFNEDLAKHYCQVGWQLGYDPTPDFSTNRYLERNPELWTENRNPFLHFITTEKRSTSQFDCSKEKIHERESSDKGTLSTPDSDCNIEKIVEPYFDAAYYLNQNLDVAGNGVDPLEHYCDQGWRERRDPNREFSTGYYLDANPDIEDSGINPFWHYIVAGKSEGRTIRHPGGYKAEILKEMRPLSETSQDWISSTASPPELLSAKQLLAFVVGDSNDNMGRIILSVGHDNYRRHPGGVQLCIQREEALAREAGDTYVFLYPWQPLPRLASQSENIDPIIGLLRDGQEIGFSKMSKLIQVTHELATSDAEINVVIHHLLGHSPEMITDLTNAAGGSSCVYWLHDFLTLCPSYTLQRNSVTYCNAPDLDSNSCSLCVYGVERKDHLSRFEKMFSALDVHVVAPSRSAKTIWLTHGNLKASKISVIPHVKLKWSKRLGAKPNIEGKTISVGFIGTAAPHKGWPLFQRLISEYQGAKRYRFVYFGNSNIKMKGLECVDVHVTADNPMAMVEAVKREEIDIVLHWAAWPETFSISTFEALAGGAFVITNEISGNIKDTIHRLNRGTVLADENALLKFFAGSGADVLAHERRAVFLDQEVQCSNSNLCYTAFKKEARS